MKIFNLLLCLSSVLCLADDSIRADGQTLRIDVQSVFTQGMIPEGSDRYFGVPSHLTLISLSSTSDGHSVPLPHKEIKVMCRSQSLTVFAIGPNGFSPLKLSKGIPVSVSTNSNGRWLFFLPAQHYLNPTNLLRAPELLVRSDQMKDSEWYLF